MATSGSFTTTARYASDSSNKKWYIFSWTLVSQDIISNSSTISYSVTGGGSKTSGWVMSYDRSVVIQGDTVYSSSADIQLTTGYNVTSGTKTIYHDINGNATLTASISSHIASTGSGGTSNGSNSWALPNIPRTSDISTQTPTVMGITQNIIVTQKNSAFSSIIYYRTSIGENIELGRIESGIEPTTFTWNIPDITDEWLISDKATYVITCDTYIGAGYTGQKLQRTFNVIAKVPEDVLPLGSMVLSDQENLPTGWGYIVNYSKLRSTMNFDNSRDRNGYLDKAIVTFEGRKVEFDTTELVTTVVLNDTETISSNNPTITGELIDSRGRSVNFSQTITAMTYTKPQLSIELTRCDVNGNPSVIEPYCLVKAKWIIQSVLVEGVEDNEATITVNGGYDSITYQVQNPIQNSLITIGILDGFPSDEDTYANATITDKLDSTSLSSLKLPKADLAFSAWSDGTDNGISFGRPAIKKGFWNYLDTNLVTNKDINLINPDGSSAGKTMKTDDLFMTAVNLGAQVTRVSGGTLSVNALYKWGPVYTLILNIKNSSSIASGSNAFQGTLAAAYRPPYTISSASYYGNHSWGLNITSSGTVILRNASASAQAIPDGVEISVTWIKV